MVIFAQEVMDWSKIIAAIAGAGISAAFGLLLWWLNKKKPNKIEVLTIRILSLVNVARTVRSRIVTTFDNRPIAALSQVEYAVTNTGPDTIADIVLNISFPTKTSILETELSGVASTKENVSENALRTPTDITRRL